MAELRDSPRPKVYWPNTPSQWREPTVDDCTWYATEFAFQAASKNHLNMHPVKDLREKSSDTEGGTPVPVALRDTEYLWPKSEEVAYKYGQFTKAEIRRALKDEKTIVYGGDYEKLPQHYRRWTYNDTFNHAMASRDYREVNGVGFTFLYDPLGGGPQRDFYDGEWIRLDDLLAFNWSGSKGEYVGIVYRIRRDTMIKGNVERRSDKYIDLPEKTDIYDAPLGEVIRTTNKPLRLDYFGYAGGGWWAVEIWVNDGLVIAYVKKNDKYERGNWPVTPDPDPEPVDPNPELVARVAELEFALSEVKATAELALAE